MVGKFDYALTITGLRSSLNQSNSKKKVRESKRIVKQEPVLAKTTTKSNLRARTILTKLTTKQFSNH